MHSPIILYHTVSPPPYPVSLSGCICLYKKKQLLNKATEHKLHLSNHSSFDENCLVQKEFISLFLSVCVKVSHVHSIYCRKLRHLSIQTMHRTNCHTSVIVILISLCVFTVIEFHHVIVCTLFFH